MSNSLFVCGRRGCGIPLSGSGTWWRHALGGRTGAIPAHRKHKPVPVLREDYNRAYGLSTPVAEARALLAVFRTADDTINGKKG